MKVPCPKCGHKFLVLKKSPEIDGIFWVCSECPWMEDGAGREYLNIVIPAAKFRDEREI